MPHLPVSQVGRNDTNKMKSETSQGGGGYAKRPASQGGSGLHFLLLLLPGASSSHRWPLELLRGSQAPRRIYTHIHIHVNTHTLKARAQGPFTLTPAPVCFSSPFHVPDAKTRGFHTQLDEGPETP